VRAERRLSAGSNGADDVEVLVAERPQGSFSRQLFLGETLDADRIEANYESGVLSLRIPVAEAAKPRRVQVTSSETSNAAITTSAGSASS
jgi:HSP20 family protein